MGIPGSPIQVKKCCAKGVCKKSERNPRSVIIEYFYVCVSVSNWPRNDPCHAQLYYSRCFHYFSRLDSDEQAVPHATKFAVSNSLSIDNRSLLIVVILIDSDISSEESPKLPNRHENEPPSFDHPGPSEGAKDSDGHGGIQHYHGNQGQPLVLPNGLVCGN